MKTGYYWKHAAGLKERLVASLSRDQLRELHQRVWWRHFAIVARQLILLALAVWGALAFTNPLAWLPLSIYIGFTAFNFTVLLHEEVHRTLFHGSHRRLQAIMGYFYALPSGISRSQFTRWHLDHHDELGNELGDPKRHWLSPKVNKRWVKMLYCTPALFPIYFRAAACEAASYPEALRQRIGRERRMTIVTHVAAMIAIVALAGWGGFAKVYAIPYFLVFPVAFTLNRLGQHYNIDPERPANWGTLMKASRLWDFLFLWSNYHLEHHYFPSVPFYNLRALHLALRGFYQEQGIREHTYRDILWDWFVRNRAPHTNWGGVPAASEARATSTAAVSSVTAVR